MNRAIGIVVLVVGLLVMFGGLGWAYKQYQDEDKNNNTPGPFNNPDESKENTGSAMQGFWVAGGGFALACVGVVLTVMGGRSRAAA
jgi:hypothetical protein